MKAATWLWSGVRRPLKWYQVLIASALILLLVLAVWMIALYHMQTSHPDLTEVADLTGLTFPSQTELVASHLYSWQGQVLWAKVTLPRSEVEPFFQQERLLSAQSSRTDRLGVADVPTVPLAAPSWWKPDAATEFVALSSVMDSPPAGQLRQVKILLDLGGNETVTAYIYGL